jgi:hypothetical protein
VESLKTQYKHPHIARNRSVNAMQSQHDHRAIAMIAVQTPTDCSDYFFIKYMVFLTAI